MIVQIELYQQTMKNTIHFGKSSSLAKIWGEMEKPRWVTHVGKPTLDLGYPRGKTHMGNPGPTWVTQG